MNLVFLPVPACLAYRPTVLFTCAILWWITAPICGFHGAATSPVTVARGEQRSPQAGERIDTTDAQRVALAALGVFGQVPLRSRREGRVIYRRRPPRHEMVVEDLAQLPLGEIRGGVERHVKVFQAVGEQWHVEHLGLCEPHVQAKVGDRQPVIGFDQLRPAGWTSFSPGELHAEPGDGRIRVVGEESY